MLKAYERDDDISRGREPNLAKHLSFKIKFVASRTPCIGVASIRLSRWAVLDLIHDSSLVVSDALMPRFARGIIYGVPVCVIRSELTGSLHYVYSCKCTICLHTCACIYITRIAKTAGQRTLKCAINGTSRSNRATCDAGNSNKKF